MMIEKIKSRAPSKDSPLFEAYEEIKHRRAKDTRLHDLAREIKEMNEKVERLKREAEATGMSAWSA